MKTPVILCLAVLICLATNAQKKDEKYLKTANQQLQSKDFEKAEHTLEEVSPAAQTEARYLQLFSVVEDSLHHYEKAIGAYEQWLKLQADEKGVAERITALREEWAKVDAAEKLRLEKMKNCLKCKGTGYISTQVICPTCSGFKIVTKDCGRCDGTGMMLCNGCAGQGKVEYRVGDQTYYRDCMKCGGGGKLTCTAYCNHGKITEDCRKCNASGLVTKNVKCDLH